MKYRVDDVEFIYERYLYKINVLEGEECIDCLDLDYVIHDVEDFKMLCRDWIEDNR